MTRKIDDQLVGIISDLERTIESIPAGNSSLETKKEDAYLMIYGNSRGLMRLARAALKLAEQQIHGSHFSFDSYSELSSCEQPFEIVFAHADWELN